MLCTRSIPHIFRHSTASVLPVTFICVAFNLHSTSPSSSRSYMSRAVIQEANDRVNLAGKNVVVVGGTQGIGAATALRFASLGASVLISGRNEARGSSMVQSLRTTYSNASKILRREGRLKGNEKEDEVAASSSSPIGSDIPEFTFVKADIGTVEGCLSLVKEVKDWDRLKDEGIYALIMTAGSLNFGPRRENKEGIESTFATNFLSKFTILNSLLSQLQSSAHSRVVTVLHGACGVTVDPSDLQVTKGFNFIKAANNSAGLLDIMTDQFARRHTTTPRSPRFIHVFPGVVNTDSTKPQAFPGSFAIPPNSSSHSSQPTQGSLPMRLCTCALMMAG
ncbi:hypothetical protein BC829DRAFT_485951 [Chytridium lagenaria]|nr:hypothetical protein BC829DRAFT_485951 [Chytridium lagenaria]